MRTYEIMLGDVVADENGTLGWKSKDLSNTQFHMALSNNKLELIQGEWRKYVSDLKDADNNTWSKTSINELNNGEFTKLKSASFTTRPHAEAKTNGLNIGSFAFRSLESNNATLTNNEDVEMDQNSEQPDLYRTRVDTKVLKDMDGYDHRLQADSNHQ